MSNNLIPKTILQKGLQKGLLIHYGLYSVFAYDNPRSAKCRKHMSGSELYYGRLIFDGGLYNYFNGEEQVKKHHKEVYNNVDYFTYGMKHFKTNPQIIENWIKFALENGYDHIILTVKHSDGFCLWNTSTTNRSAPNFLNDFVKLCKQNQIKYGFYYYWYQFDIPFQKSYYDNYVKKQLLELDQYNPDIWWFNGDWKIKQKTVIKDIRQFLIYLNNKRVPFNDKIISSNLDLQHIKVYEGGETPDTKIKEAWTYINAVGYSWGYNREQTSEYYKSYDEIQTINKEVFDKEGTVLWNIGADERGQIINFEQYALKK